MDCSDLRNEAKQLCVEEFPWWDAVQNIADNGSMQLEDDINELHQNVLNFVSTLTNRVTELEGAIATIDDLDQAHDQAQIQMQSVGVEDL